ncbi:MAG: hypothetical protein Q7K43_05480, partial [Candidatus Woesearchaeota archaeon]|nr:hypothetical protein [Candidatus Woesearchaeota archaeon]
YHSNPQQYNKKTAVSLKDGVRALQTATQTKIDSGKGVIVIDGRPGVGKSSLEQLLQNSFPGKKVVILHGDEIIQSGERILSTIKKAIEQADIVIYEATGSTTDVLSMNLEVPVITAFVEANEEARRAAIIRRERSGKRIDTTQRFSMEDEIKNFYYIDPAREKADIVIDNTQAITPEKPTIPAISSEAPISEYLTITPEATITEAEQSIQTLLPIIVLTENTVLADGTPITEITELETLVNVRSAVERIYHQTPESETAKNEQLKNALLILDDSITFAQLIEESQTSTRKSWNAYIEQGKADIFFRTGRESNKPLDESQLQEFYDALGRTAITGLNDILPVVIARANPSNTARLTKLLGAVQQFISELPTKTEAEQVNADLNNKINQVALPTLQTTRTTKLIGRIIATLITSIFRALRGVVSYALIPILVPREPITGTLPVNLAIKKVIKQIGHGVGGEIYLVQLENGQEVALKVSSSARARSAYELRQEARTLATRLKNIPQIPQLLSISETSPNGLFL